MSTMSGALAAAAARPSLAVEAVRAVYPRVSRNPASVSHTTRSSSMTSTEIIRLGAGAASNGGEHDHRRGSSPGRALDRDRSAVLLDDTLAESETNSRSARLRGEED